MRHGGKKWSSGSHVPIQFSFNALFLSERDGTGRFNARGKSRRMRTTLSLSSSKRRRRQRRRQRRSWCATAVPWVRRKKGGIEYSPDAFSPKNSHMWNITKKKQKYLLRSNEQKETKNTRKREKELSFFLRFFIYLTALPKTVCCFYIRTILRALLR